MLDSTDTAELRRYQRALIALLAIPIVIALVDRLFSPENPWVEHGLTVITAFALMAGFWILTHKFTRSRWLVMMMGTVGPLIILGALFRLMADLQVLGDFPIVGHHQTTFDFTVRLIDVAVSGILLIGLCLVIVETASSRIEQYEQQRHLEGEIQERRRVEEERRRLESKLWQAQKAESIGMLAGGIAHDFNNLLMAIMGNADLLRLDLPPNSDENRRARSIVDAASQAAALTEQLLAYAGRGQFMREPIHLSQLVQDSGELLRASFPGQAKIEFDLDDELPAIECDSAQLRQVIVNLFSNAVEALGDQPGRVSVTTRMRRLSRADLDRKVGGENLREGDYVALEVKDTGSGMSERALHRIFDPYYSTKAPGRGLGLSSVLGIVKGNDGAILVDSRVKYGTTVTVVFPASDKSPVCIQKSSTFAPNGLNDARILVADDEFIVLKLAHEILTRSGYDVLTASDGEEAVAAFGEHGDSIALVLLDLSMPGLDGHGAYRKIRERSANVPILLSSGYTSDSLPDEITTDPAAGFLHKPYQAERMLQAVGELIETQSARIA
jgi:two-component system, cell cycle sensor histidine kinase and response regulator CckA